MLQKYAIMLLSKIIFREWLTAILLLRRDRPERSAAFSRDSMLSGSALVLLELSEASSPESSTSSPSLETLVPEAKATSTTLSLVAFGLSSHVETAHAQYARC